MYQIYSIIKFNAKQSFSRSMFRYSVVINPIFNSIIIGMIYSNKSEDVFIIYAMFGAAIASFWSTVCFSSASDISREKRNGTLSILFASPLGFFYIVIIKILSNLLFGIVSFFLCIFFTVLFFNKYIGMNTFFLITYFLIFLSMISISVFLCGLFALSRSASLLINVIEYPFLIISGSLFSIEKLPFLLQVFSSIIPITWVMKLIKEYMLIGYMNSNLFFMCLIVIFLNIIYIILGYLFFKLINKRCRETASLEIY